MSADDLDRTSLLELFRLEAECQIQVLTAGLLALDRDPTAADQLESCMRAAHSLKGAASIVGLAAGVRVSHAMEDCFVAAQRGQLTLAPAHVDLLLGATDLVAGIAATDQSEVDIWDGARRHEIDRCLTDLGQILSGEPPATKAETPVPAPIQRRRSTDAPVESTDRVLRVTAESLNRLLGLAGESLVESRWLKSFAESLMRIKRLQRESDAALEALRDALVQRGADERTDTALKQVHRIAHECQHLFTERLAELEVFDRRSISLSNRLYDEALTCRMRPFSDGTQAFPRMVRDVAQSIGKSATLEIVGDTTQVDRDVLTQLDAPLGHLLRNAIDHGLETPAEREAAGKPATGIVRIEARHSAGQLHITVADDGRGIDLDKLRRVVVERQLINAQAAAVLSDAELLEFLFLPGFSTKGNVTDISGRGVGLDVVQDLVRRLRGTVRVASQLGHGTRFQLQLPLTLSVVRTLLAEVSGEPYAFPLASVFRIVKLPKSQVAVLEGRQHFDLDGRRVGLVAARQVLEVPQAKATTDVLSVIVVGDSGRMYGLVVDRFLGERELVVQPLDPQLGRIKDIAAGALMQDGAPVLIVDVADIMCSMDKLAADGGLGDVARDAKGDERPRKRVLVVDDSLTVREIERKLLNNSGYEVEVAVDGMDGWNAIITGRFDLVVTDIDMPRMDGIELVTLINRDPHLKGVPVMVVSYKDRDEDRRRGLDAGAAHYLTKGSFHDETLVRAVVDLIGEAVA
jgi:two-component system, chemotaxis family, sensor histidine kinase and response regulator WspE